MHLCQFILSLHLLASEEPKAGPRPSAPTAIEVFRGMSDASAAVPITDDLILVANDEDNVLRLYSLARPGAALQRFDLTRHLALERGSSESDFEAATRRQDRIYWISSHGRNAEGKEAPNRRRFFATDLEIKGTRVHLSPVGSAYTRLIDDFLADPRLTALGIHRAVQRAPKAKGGLNIEGLCDLGDGGLLVGFRNPLSRKQAVVVPLANPDALFAGSRAVLGQPRLLDLGGLGIRDIVRYGEHFLIIAGPPSGAKRFRLYEWAGGDASPCWRESVAFGDFTPEALIPLTNPTGPPFLFLSDDGAVEVDGVPSKRLTDPSRQQFRALRLAP